jgi:hypothetical protein
LIGKGFGRWKGVVVVEVGSYGVLRHKTFGYIAAECCGFLGGFGTLGVGDLSETCVLDYWQAGWGLMGSGGKWSRFSSNAVEQNGSMPFWS